MAFAFGEALIVRADLGVMSWDVLHQGLARHLGLSIGQWSVIVGALVLLLWIPLRERPGLGTVSNVLVIGLALDVFLAVLSAPPSLPARVALLVDRHPAQRRGHRRLRRRQPRARARATG